ncbi:MAG TPA: hypothetical protein VIT44_00025 [Cyclobacteriaceae bacterium]
MRTLRLLLYFIIIAMISCDNENSSIDSTNPTDQIPTDDKKYQSKGYFLDGQFDGREILIQDTALTIIGSTFGGFNDGSDSVTLSFGTEFRIIDPKGKPLETFTIDIKIRELKSNLDSKYFYKDLTKINKVITEGLWSFCYNGAVLKDKGVSVSYMDHRGSGTQWFTESFDDQMFDYSSFEFNLNKVVDNIGDKTLVVEGSLECMIYNSKNPVEQKNLKTKFKGPLIYFR